MENPFEPVRKLLQELSLQKRLIKSCQERSGQATNRIERIKEEIGRGLGTWHGSNKLVRSGKTYFLVSREAMGMGKMNIVEVEAA
jgi:hypothetical protein